MAISRYCTKMRTLYQEIAAACGLAMTAVVGGVFFCFDGSLNQRCQVHPSKPLCLLELVAAVLQHIQLVVSSLQVQQLLMVTLLYDLAVGQQNNVVCVLDGT